MIGINETVLEMHFHRPLMECIREVFDLGSLGQLNFYKYSPQLECFVGFDQAYVRTQLTQQEFFNLLKASAQNGGYKIPGGDDFLGYFLQYKVGKEMTKRMATTPDSINARPYLRFELDTAKKDKTGFSQHELLHNLQQNHGAFVYYACPMLFRRDELYEIHPDLDKLRLVELDSSPGLLQDNATHYIFFDDPAASPVWASEPQDGTAVSPEGLAKIILEFFERSDPGQSGPALLELLTNEDAWELPTKADYSKLEESTKMPSILTDAMTIVRVSSARYPADAVDAASRRS